MSQNYQWVTWLPAITYLVKFIDNENGERISRELIYFSKDVIGSDLAVIELVKRC